MAEVFFDLKIKNVIKETADAVTIVFEQPSSGKISYKSGQFLTLINEIDGKEERRAYSLCSSTYVDEDLAVTVKRVEGGKVSNYLNDNAKTGEVIKVMEPMGNFATEPADEQRHVVLFGGGSGITPLMSITKTILIKEPQSVVSLIYVNKNKDSIIFDEKLKELEASHSDKFKLLHYWDENHAGKKRGLFGMGKKDTGLLNRDRLNALLETLHIEPSDNTEYYMCGPQGMMEVVEKTLASRKVSTNVVFKESFVSSVNPTSETMNTSGDEKIVSVHLNGEEMTFGVKEGNYILQTALNKGHDLPFSCQSGLCTACMGKIKEGEVDMQGQQALTDKEIEEGYCLTCVGKPISDKVVIEIE